MPLGIGIAISHALQQSNPQSFELPTDDLVLWYDASLDVYEDTAGTDPAENEDVVYNWKDQSGNNNHAVWPDPDGTSPEYLTNVVNGRPVVNADLDNTTILVLTTPISATSFHLFIVMQKAETVGGTLLANGDSASETCFRSINDTSFRVSSEAAFDVIFTLAQGVDELLLFELQFDGTDLVGRKNGAQTDTDASFSGDTFTFAFLFNEQADGSGIVANLFVAELALFEADLSAELAAQARDYLNNKYSIY